jgi:hypothetical protein
MNETNYLQAEVTTFDGKTHIINVHKTGKVTWKASAYVDGEYVEGIGARTMANAIANWKMRYRHSRDS